MFFYLGKIFWVLMSPLTIIAFILLAGCGLRLAGRDLWGNRLLLAGAILFLIPGFLPIGANMIVWLETRHENPSAALPDRVDGIIILGGAVHSEMSQIHNQPSLNEFGERVTEGVRLSLLYPHARIVYAGGEGNMIPSSTTEAAETKKLLENMGISTERIVFESTSRTTYENMIDSKALLNPQAGEKWLLVTSAFHLPRSVGVFKKGGWDVIPYPAGYLEKGAPVLVPRLDVLGNFYKLQVAMKEIVGIIAYALTGKI